MSTPACFVSCSPLNRITSTFICLLGLDGQHYDCRWECATLFSLLLGGVCYFGSQRLIGAVNGLLVFGIIISFTALVAVASGDLHWDALLKANLEAVPVSIPIVALSFVYQNVVPVLCTNLEGNLSKVRTAILLGTAIPLVLFLVWNAVILGTITGLEIVGSNKIVDPLEQLRSTNGAVGVWYGLAAAGCATGAAIYLSDLLLFFYFLMIRPGYDLDIFQPSVACFTCAAIAVYRGMVITTRSYDFFLLKLPSGQSSPLPYLLTLIPPLILSQLDPEIFFKALDFAGTYGVLVLFGILPAAMAWADRYSSSSQPSELPLLVPGGRLTLSLVIGGAGSVILSEIIANFGHQ
ncbi:hypothetical protein RJ639_019522 [Escallonia herrerae]|uniref:Tyrosine-specific transport protein n=1 Tax=Escallonia herrerae TaxID=1293975 RepID=A0AA89AIQ4_9ASTE|nr:hypothetical protein RJ639_019522 [Escallonia herrerae]